MRDNGPVTRREYAVPADQTLVSVTDLKGRIVFCNRAFEAVSGFAREELLGQPHNLIRHPDMPQEAFRDMWETLQAGHPWSAPVKNRRKGGDHYWVQANATPVKDGRRIVGYLSVRTALSAERAARADALYARMRQEAASRRPRTALHRGRVVRRDLAGRLIHATGAAAAAIGLPGALGIGAALASALAAQSLPLATWLPLAIVAALGAHFAGRRIARIPLRALLDDVLHLAAGDLTHQVATDGQGLMGEFRLAVAQLAVNLRTVVADARTEVENVRGAVAEIAAGNRDLSARTEAQASSLQQTAASMEQIHGTVRQSTDSAIEGARLASETADIAQHSHESVLAVVQAMNGIDESSRRIGEIIHVIEGVAFQTNILALNAAVEAARAGESGRGFAVVAAEVRTLAQRTTQAAGEIRRLISESAERVAAGGQQTAAARERMHDALASVGNVSALLSQISSAAGEQLGGITQVNAAVADLESITQQNAAMVEQLAAAAQSLDGQVSAVTDSMRLFRLRPGEPTAAETDAVALRREVKQAAAADDDASVVDKLQEAIGAHMKWKTTLRNAAMRGEPLDVDRIGRDDCCALGQWLHGDARRQWGRLPGFVELLDRHAHFHRTAAEVARACNAGRKNEALKMLDGGTTFATATHSTVMAIRALQLEARQAQVPAG